MDSKEMSAKWKQVKGEARVKWGKLTDDDLDRIGGHRDKLIGRLEELYQRSRKDIEREVDEFFSSRESDKGDSSRTEAEPQDSSR
ncbi:MAG: CsbD family protein [Chloroflexota bacterium]